MSDRQQRREVAGRGPVHVGRQSEPQLARHHAEGIEPERAFAFLDRADALLGQESQVPPGVEAHMVGLRGAALRAAGLTASQVARITYWCLPVASQGPFGSTPPVETMAVVLPSRLMRLSTNRGCLRKASPTTHSFSAFHGLCSWEVSKAWSACGICPLESRIRPSRRWALEFSGSINKVWTAHLVAE